MAEHSTIEWTDATWNPITGCTIVDAGCTNCYAMALAGSRLRNHPSRAGLTRVTGGRSKWTGEVRLNEQWMDQPLRWSRPRRIFVCAHGDLFHEAVPDEWIDRVFAVMGECRQHTFQVLTKRPERMAAYLTARRTGRPLQPSIGGGLLGYHSFNCETLPPRNIWLGTSASDQASADLRIPHLLAAPAAVRFLSMEPLLGLVRLDQVAAPHGMAEGQPWLNALNGYAWDNDGDTCPTGGRLDLVIVGGESGPGARPMHPDWARSLRDQCVAAGVAFHFKQWGEWAPGENAADVITGHRANATWWDDDWLFGETNMADPEADWDDEPDLYRIGKSRAGRLLDGRTWDQMPEVRHG